MQLSLLVISMWLQEGDVGRRESLERVGCCASWSCKSCCVAFSSAAPPPPSAVFRCYDPHFQPGSLDEASLDVTDCEWGGAAWRLLPSVLAAGEAWWEGG